MREVMFAGREGRRRAEHVRGTGRAAMIAAALAAWVVASACTSAEAPSQTGGESHFLRACAEQCVAGLSCIDGVCTRACTGDDACLDMSALARCPDPSGIEFARSCEVTCAQDDDCTELGASLGCADGVCREQSVDVERAPLVMLVVDTSGSMERLPNCTCVTPSCGECLPDCAAAQRNRFAVMLEALSGSWEDYRCTTHSRIEPVSSEINFTYDLGYYLPYSQPPSGEQLGDGVLDTYRSRVRFGIATFDGLDTYGGAPPLVSLEDGFSDAASASVSGLWSYGSSTEEGLRKRDDGRVVGAFRYPNCADDYRMDTGIRGPQAKEGAVRHAASVDEMLEVNARIQDDLRRVRPYGGTPIAAAFDDLLYYFDGDPEVAAHLRDEARDRHVILITDGYPDDDYRGFRCACATEGSDPLRCGPAPNDPAEMYCPYPTAEEAVAALRGRAVSAVHVVMVDGLAALEPDKDPSLALVLERLDSIAQAGGSERAHMAETTSELRDVLSTIIDDVLGTE